MFPVLAAWLAFAVADTPYALPINIEGCQFGEVYQTNSLPCDLLITNSGEKTTTITAIHTLNNNDTVEPTTLAIAPKSSVSIHAALNLLGDSGQTSHQFELVTDLPQQPKVGLVAEGFVDSILDDPKSRLKLGIVNILEPSPHIDFSLSSEESHDFKITRLVKVPTYLDAELGPAPGTVRVSVKPNAPWGLNKDAIVVETNNPTQKFAEFLVDSDIHGNVVASPDPIAFGLIRERNRNEATVRLEDVEGADLQIGAIRINGVSASASSEECSPRRGSCRLLKVIVDDGQVPGILRGTIDVTLPKYRRTLSIRVSGFFLKASTVVRDLEQATEQANESKTSRGVATNSVANALQQATRERKDEVIPGKGPLLSWQVANEVGIYGYIVYRSDRVDGSYVRVSGKVIPVSPDAADGVSSSYKWRDESAEAGRTYWYYISSIRKTGAKQKLTGPQKVLAK